jgi:hypothetical protein
MKILTGIVGSSVEHRYNDQNSKSKDVGRNLSHCHCVHHT